MKPRAYPRDTRLRLRIIRIVDRLQCPRCGKETGHYPEETGDGWRLLCRACHGAIVVTEDDHAPEADDAPCC